MAVLEKASTNSAKYELYISESVVLLWEANLRRSQLFIMYG